MIGKVIQQKRKEAGLTQAQLAERLGVTAPAVNRWEKDLSFPDAMLLAPLARCLKTDLNELFSFYDSLSDKERELVVDKAMTMFMERSDDEAIAYIEENLRQNLSDGQLYLQMAKLMYGRHLLRKSSNPEIYLDLIIKCYERALELLPEEEQNISETLMSVYASKGDIEKATSYWERLKGKRLALMQSHANMLFLLKDYSAAASEMKEIVLRKAIDLSTDLGFLHDNLMACGNTELAEIAGDKAASLRKLFELWEGFEIMSLVSSAMTAVDAEAEKEYLANFVSLDPRGKEISDSPLFADVALGTFEGDDSTIADQMANLMNTLKKLDRK